MEKIITNKPRQSNIELYRIIVMLLIVAHHYVVNSGLPDAMRDEPMNQNTLFYVLFGMWGKTGINCFVLITGWFMCKAEITLRKFLKLLFEVMFYKIVINLFFMLTGYIPFSVKGIMVSFWPIWTISDDFVSCFLLYYLTIPFLNILIRHMTQRQHLQLVALLLFIYTFMGSFSWFHVSSNYAVWFCVLHVIASYLRYYGLPWRIRWGWASLVSVMASISCVMFFTWRINHIFQPVGLSYSFYPLADSNQPLALLTALCLFMWAKDVRMGYHKWINTIASSTFGVLLIHANSNTMRQLLWRDTVDCVGHYDDQFAVIYALGGCF